MHQKQNEYIAIKSYNTVKDRKENKPLYNTRQDTSCRDDIEEKKKKTARNKNPKLRKRAVTKSAFSVIPFNVQKQISISGVRNRDNVTLEEILMEWYVL